MVLIRISQNILKVVLGAFRHRDNNSDNYNEDSSSNDST